MSANQRFHCIKTVLSEAVVQKGSVNNTLKKNYVIFIGEDIGYRSLFFNNVNRVYFHFLVLQVIPSEAAVYK